MAVPAAPDEDVRNAGRATEGDIARGASKRGDEAPGRPWGEVAEGAGGGGAGASANSERIGAYPPDGMDCTRAGASPHGETPSLRTQIVQEATSSLKDTYEGSRTDHHALAKCGGVSPEHARCRHT